MRHPTEKEARLQRHRLRMTLISVVNYSLTAIVISLYAWNSEVPWVVPCAFLVAGLSVSGMYCLVILRGWSLKLRDPVMLVPQIAASVVVHLGFLVAVPKLWVLFLVAVLVTYVFGMASFGPRQLARAWLLMSGACALALLAVRGRFAQMGTSDATLLITWLFFFFSFRQLTDIGTQFSTLRSRLSDSNKRLSESLQRVQELASHDDLTGAFNRRSLLQMLSDELARTQRTGLPFCVAVLDLDHFKSINDRFGHLVGDAVLKAFCAAASASIRVTDRLARYGGEEFVLLLAPSTTDQEADIAAERVRQAVESHGWEAIAPGLKVTVSAGIAQSCAGESIEQLIGRADEALYAAKRSGRNRTLVAAQRSFSTSNAMTAGASLPHEGRT